MTLRGDRRRALRVSVDVFFVVLAAAFALACSTGAPPPPEPGPMDRADYVIGTADVLRIQVWRNPELSVEVPVRPDTAKPTARGAKVPGAPAPPAPRTLTPAPARG